MPVIIIIVTIIIGLGIRGVFLERKKRLALYDSLLKDFGKDRNRDYPHGKKHRAAVLNRSGACSKGVDEITWSDLDLERVFERIDKTKSAVGEEYLYYILHNTGYVLEDKEFSELVGFLSEDEKTRTELLISLCRIGYVKKYSPFDYTDNLTTRKKHNPIGHIILDVLYIPFIALIFFKPVPGAVLLFLLILVSIFIYFKDKRALDGVVESLGFLIRLSNEALKLEKKDISYLKAEREKIKALSGVLYSIKSGGGYLVASGRSGQSMSSGPAEVLLTYFNMLFSFDLIQFDLLTRKLSGKKKELEDMLLLFGRLDAAISVADFRKSLEGDWTEPDFSDNKGSFLLIREGYHPLVRDCVRNTVDTDKCILLTGSNASGKSTFLRMAAINAILAQTVYTVCAKEYSAPVYNIYSSIALKDDLLGKESFFLVEIRSLKRVIDALSGDRPVLCFIDEVLRVTNTIERISASCTILKYLKEHNALCFAATHDGELAELLNDVYRNMHFSETVSGKDVSFDYRIKDGIASSRNAIKLLEMYGYPEEIFRGAGELALSKLTAVLDT